MGRITGLACPSVRPSVPYGLLELENKQGRKTKIGMNVFHGAGIAGRTAAYYVGTGPTFSLG